MDDLDEALSKLRVYHLKTGSKAEADYDAFVTKYGTEVEKLFKERREREVMAGKKARRLNLIINAA
jgi:hypothetical protein